MKIKSPLWSIAALFCAVAITHISTARGADPKPGEINVILWFDTEDYLLPADDDATKRLCEMLTERHIRATFKLVGEKARVLQKRGRTDVIEALKKHDIGYHSDFHSVHPTPSEYLAECGLLDGIAEFTRRESKGAADVRRILGVETLSCYGQPGSSWGSQTIAALKAIGVAPHGIPCYVDEGSHIGLNEKPFWYCGALVVYKMGSNRTRMDLFKRTDRPDQPEPSDPLEKGKEDFTKIADRLRKEGGGLISIFYHPCEWVHREFWDGVNFKRGANPPRELWKAPPQRTVEETNGAFDRFAKYIDHMRAIPGVRFVTASDLTELYPDRARVEGATAEDADQIAARLLDEKSTGINFVVIGEKAFSPADQFEVLAQAVSDVNRIGALNFPLRPTGVLGPDSAPPARWEKARLSWPEFADGLRDVRSYIETEHRLPARVFVGPASLPPADYLYALASAYSYLRKKHTLPMDEGVPLKAMEVLTAKQVAEDTPKLFGDWVIHKEGFRAPKILDVARLQAWTLKPAIRPK